MSFPQSLIFLSSAILKQMLVGLNAQETFCYFFLYERFKGVKLHILIALKQSFKNLET